MERVELYIAIDRPVRAVYDQCTRFEDLPKFVPSLLDVRQLDDTQVRCRAQLAGRWSEWDAQITEQEPDTRISWRHKTGSQSAGTLRFSPLPDGGSERTQLRLILAWANPRVSLAVVQGEALEALDALRRYIEGTHTPVRGWRGTIDHGVSQGQPL